MRSGTKAFKPKARLIQILGEHLIKDATVGIIELVKNSYDADATLVDITMKRLNTNEAIITIKDNGVGMDLDTFLNKWMNPATGHKEEQKEKKLRTPKGRLPLGEKGVGRFAAQQIGNNLRIITKVKNAPYELIVNLDWKLFEVAEKNLEDVEIRYREAEPEYFSKNESGTILQIFELKYKFTEEDIEKISNTLKRMKSPFKGAKDFEIGLNFEESPEEFTKYQALEISDIIEKAHYSLVGLVDNKGNLEYEYRFNVPGEKPNYIKDTKNLIEGKLDIKTPTICGGFMISIYNYDKSTKWKWLLRSSVSKNDLDELCGINVYRDGIRILPYGEKGDDWLELDKKRIQTPVKRISNENTIGLIEINQVDNSFLIDKTNREGLRENLAFQEFKALVKQVIQIFENERIHDRPQTEIKEKKKDELLIKEIEEIKNKIAELIGILKASIDKKVVEKVNVLEFINNKIDGFEKQYEETVQEYNNRNEMLFNLAGTGLAAERFTHEFAKLIDNVDKSFSRLKTMIDLSEQKIKREVEVIQSSVRILRNDIRLLGPMFYVKKVAKEKELSIHQIIESTIYLHESTLRKENIKYEITGNNFLVTMTEGNCMQIINNLLDNSIYWLSGKSKNSEREIKFLLDPKNKSLYVSDNGPGIPERNREIIFEPFVTTKSADGRGLGLYIVKEILDEKDWGVFVVNQDDYKGLLDGANFKIIFNNNGS